MNFMASTLDIPDRPKAPRVVVGDEDRSIKTIPSAPALDLPFYSPELEPSHSNPNLALPQGPFLHKSASSGALYESRSTGDRQGTTSMTRQDEQIENNQINMVNYDLVKLWIRSCVRNHGADCHRRELHGSEAQEYDIVLIDVQQKCLVKATTAARYFALSYVWGSVTQFATTLRLFPGLSEPGALLRHENAIPQVIKDATTFVQLVGERYLWVDALCIIQDDAAAKHQQISHMAAIYNSASVTIVAVAGRDASANLPGIKRGTRWLRGWRSHKQLVTPLRPDLVLKVIERTLYNTRGWTFQERLLSRRCIYFLDEQMYFQCRKALWCEEPPLLQLPSIVPLQPLDVVFSPMNHASLWAERILEQRWDEVFSFYANLASEYSKKKLTYPEDVIDAFSGVLQALEGLSHWSFLYGMPEQMLDFALLWSSEDSCRRMPAANFPSSYFPSWSWVGWIGAVHFKTVFDVELTEMESPISTFEIQHFEELSGYRSVERLVTAKSAGGDFITSLGDETEPICTSSAGLGTILRLFTQRINAHEVTFTPMPLFWYLNDTINDTIATRENLHRRNAKAHKGTLVLLDGRPCGILYGIIHEELQKFSGKTLKLILISWCEWGPEILFDREDTRKNAPEEFSNAMHAHAESTVWIGREVHPSYFPEKERQEDRSDDKHFSCYFLKRRYIDEEHYTRVCNVMLIQQKGPLSERVAIGQMRADAWVALQPTYETIHLG